MSSRAFPWKVVLVGGAVALLVAAIGGYQYVIRSFIQAYYTSEYRPEALTTAELAQPPASHRLTDVPWLSETSALGQSLSLRMLAAQQGRLESRQTIDFMMGFTWGATAIPRRTGFFPGQDPEVGFLRAAPFLGFTRRYVTTDSADDFVRALRTFVSKGRAVRVAVDRSLLLEARGVVPHSVVLIGYDAEGFEYYEPTCDEVKRCAAMERAPGEPGLKVTTAQLLLAAESQALVFQYPWKYQLLVLEPSSAPVPELSTLLAVNGRALMGMKSAGPSTGSVAVTDTANAIERHGKDVVTPELLRGVKIAALVRRDDSIALSSLFAARPELAPAAEALDEAGKAYARAVTAFEANEPEQGAQALKEAAAFDLEAGKAMLRAGADGG
ncbi:MAG: hypothetical protein Q8N26_22725 [Myxococcales bacterium]|nr:hypothetical protein [Myxococcales bacterium]